MKHTLLVLSTLLLVGCGTSTDGNTNTKNKPTAREILVGKVTYSADNELDDPKGYYRDLYGENKVIETQHAEDGASIYEPIELDISYKEDTVIVSYANVSKTCKVTEIRHGVQFVCKDGTSFLEWDAAECIPR